MIDKMFALGTWEVHLQTEAERQLIAGKMRAVCAYVDTAVNYNNDYLLRDALQGPEALQYKVISKIAPCHFPFYDLFMDNHVKCLGRDKIDIMLIHSSRGNWQDLAVRMENDSRLLKTGVSNFSLDEIKEYKDLVGHWPCYNEIEINPHYTDLRTIEFCKEHGIKIISYGVFGGKYRAPTYVARYSVPSLVEYAAQFADIIILKPECERHVDELLDVIQNFEADDECKLEMSKVLDDKAVVPMVYDAPTVVKRAFGLKTYMNAAGQNKDDKKTVQQVLLDKPDFEMLGDYQAYLRYSFRQSYGTGIPVYIYDILVGDNGKLYAAYLYDEHGNISKINTTGKVELVEISEEGVKGIEDELQSVQH